jgi:hypothetical protein
LAIPTTLIKQMFESDVEEAWSEEIKRRLAEIDSGTSSESLGKHATNCSGRMKVNLP